MGLKDKILEAKDYKSQLLPIPEWDVTVEVRGFTSKQRDDYERAQIVDESTPDKTGYLRNIRARTLAKCLYDPETKKRIFNDADAEALGEKDGDVTARLFLLIRQLSGIADKDEVEQAAKK